MQTSAAHNFVFCTWDIKVREFIELPIYSVFPFIDIQRLCSLYGPFPNILSSVAVICSSRG